MKLFITATGTEVGKTFFTRGLARALARRGEDVVAVKPMETGVDPVAMDAEVLARACGVDLAADPAFYRARRPLAPWSATLAGEPAPAWTPMLERLRALIDRHPHVLVEGAGGPLVPVDRERDVIDLAGALALPVVLVARDALGVLSHTLTAIESIRARSIEVRGVALVVHADADQSRHSNGEILRARAQCAVWQVPAASGPDAEDDELADRLEAAGVLDALRRA
ncbi:MAG TPA: dethiobiotin synthase [Polyangiaceae bacterium LLY-WYZ-15_(1-7)]|nr:dethiobiotin synthase [Myxococcales bacterium]MAT26919.1 dethiobiotin synthase [Sandaracinus sp.]HJK89923.1 dethiobiotin synthase [Polyangiaceae bacterium LLY-WYZ-15_(1-7)]MBJ70198.1 dethiobiotin synthase [Sandaracinus sp.]HJL03122.1 dethiobiotin synthase [Polyangiaceae bacterium LLY-WYZ-15_(1-7)]